MVKMLNTRTMAGKSTMMSPKLATTQKRLIEEQKHSNMNTILKMMGTTLMKIGKNLMIGWTPQLSKRKVERRIFPRLKTQTLTVVFVTRRSQVGPTTKSMKVKTM